MDAHRTDRLTTRYARRRLSRRAALATGGGGLAMLLAADRSPTAAGEPVTLLFVQTFASGTWTLKPGQADTYELTLTGHAARTVYFSDRPQRLVGTVSTAALVATALFDPANPPNAALVAVAANGEEDVLVVELTNPRYDAAADAVRYDATPLAGSPSAGLAPLARRQRDDSFPETFGTGALFIDSWADIWDDIQHVLNP